MEWLIKLIRYFFLQFAQLSVLIIFLFKKVFSLVKGNFPLLKIIITLWAIELWGTLDVLL